MATRRLKRPRDPVELGKLIGDILSGQVEDRDPKSRDEVAADMGRKGGAEHYGPLPNRLPLAATAQPSARAFP